MYRFIMARINSIGFFLNALLLSSWLICSLELALGSTITTAENSSTLSHTKPLVGGSSRRVLSAFHGPAMGQPPKKKPKNGPKKSSPPPQKCVPKNQEPCDVGNSNDERPPSSLS